MSSRYQVFTVLINQIHRSILKLKAEEMTKFDLKGAHVSCLYYLYTSDQPLTSKGLCDICNEDKALISRALDDLEKQGYICFSSSKEEKRYRSFLHLTEQGNDIGEYISTKIDHLLDESTKGISEENRRIMLSSLETISNNLKQICQQKGE